MGREENTDNLWHDDVKITLFVFPEIIFAALCVPWFSPPHFYQFLKTSNNKSQYWPTHNII